MKKLIVMGSVLFSVAFCSGQSTPVKKDTVKVDSAQAEKIEKMPMDTLHHTMPVIPVPRKDSLNYRKTIDDADPKKPKSPNPKF